MFSRFMGLFSGGKRDEDNPKKPSMTDVAILETPIENPLEVIKQFLTGRVDVSDNDLFRAFMGLRGIVTESLNAANEEGGDRTAEVVGNLATQMGKPDRASLTRLETLSEEWVSTASKQSTPPHMQQAFAGTGMVAAYFCSALIYANPDPVHQGFSK